MAVDAEANCYLDRSKMQKEAGGIWVEDFGFDRNLGAREYYNLFYKLVQQKQQKAQAKQPSQPCNGGQGGEDGSENQKQDSAKSQNESQQNGEANNNQQDENQQQQNAGGGDTPLQQVVDSIKKESFDDHND